MGDGRAHHSVPPVTGAALYGSSGRPVGSDIVQGGVGDCFLVSTLEQYAQRQPSVIADAIRYDAKHERFDVTLHDAAGRTKIIAVTQEDLRADRSFGPSHDGGVDGPGYWPGAHPDGSKPPAWPSVMEVAYGKLSAGSAKGGTAGELGRLGNGGWPKDAIHALTGRPGTREVAAAELRNPNKAYALLETAIRENRAVLLSTNPMEKVPTDGLVKGEYRARNDPANSGHAYTVEAVGRNEDGDVVLTLRNPWGHNLAATQGVDSSDPIVHVSLKTILNNGHLENVTVGPGMVQTVTASKADYRGHATRQEATPWSAAMEAAPRPVSEQGAASDPIRRHWADMAAKGAELVRSDGAIQTGVASRGQGRARTS